jgi:AcrR family transcriptional regulator
MTQDTELRQAFDLLDQTLEAFGGDSARWPENNRQRLLTFVADNPQAQQRLAEANALDRVLNFAPGLSTVRQAALVGRVAEVAERQPRLVASAHATPSSARGIRPAAGTGWAKHGMAGAALAASLLVGIMSGQTATVGTLSEALLNDGENFTASSRQLALGDDVDSFLDEDLL